MSSNQQSVNTSPPSKYSLNCKGRLVHLSPSVVMGILNITPDSFFDGGKFTEESSILEKVRKLVIDGAQIIDVGAASSRPGASLVTEQEEERRLLPAVKLISKEFPNMILSIDTWRSGIARKAIDNGAHIINDISAGAFDSNMFKTLAELKVPYIMMHLQGNIETMHQIVDYKNLMADLIHYFQEKILLLRAMGVHDIIIDPGFGFSKSLNDNYSILKDLHQLHILNCPILVGVSRKSMINKVLHTDPSQALNGTSILNTIALMSGVEILRVHDVKEAKECILLVNALNGNQ